MLLDILKRPINKGDTVITKNYGSPTMDYVAKVIQVNKTTISVAATKRCWAYDSVAQKYNYATQESTIHRKPCECAVVTKQLAYNQATYPEFCI